ncbi:hypothetical protein SAMN02745866_00893 [Alteromonadaceae bacterium Bs31]|nr:hypothetical protein SAMN02745866_00893 [Alteromonadaceae bacterium Bs31]
MYFWLNRSSENDNVVMLAKNSVLIASCDEETYDKVYEACNNKVHPYTTFGKDNIQQISLNTVQQIISRSTDADIDIKYKTQKEIEDISLDFEDVAQKESFLLTFKKIIPAHLVFNEYQQSRIGAAIWPAISLSVALIISSFYINKWRWVALIVGGLWALASVWMLYTRLSNPPVISAWKLKGRYVGKTINAIKIGLSYAFVLILAIGFSYKLPLSYGPSALFSHLDYDELTASKVPQLVSNGADVNWVNDEGDDILTYAIAMENPDMVKALIHAGANLSDSRNAHRSALYDALQYAHNATTLTILDAGKALGPLKGMPHEAVSYGSSLEVLKKLIELGADLHEIDESGENLLTTAVRNSADLDIIDYLLQKGIEQTEEIDSVSLSEYAKEMGRLDIAGLLKRADKGELGLQQYERSAFLSNFIKQESKNLLNPKLNALAKFSTMGDDEARDEYHSLLENRVQVTAVNSYIRNSYAPHYESYCGKLDQTLGAAIQSAAQRYQAEKSEYIQAGKEIVDSDVVLEIQGKRVLSRSFKNKVEKIPTTLEEEFNGEAKLSEEELLNKCNKFLSGFAYDNS